MICVLNDIKFCFSESDRKFAHSTKLGIRFACVNCMHHGTKLACCMHETGSYDCDKDISLYFELLFAHEQLLTSILI